LIFDLQVKIKPAEYLYGSASRIVGFKKFFIAQSAKYVKSLVNIFYKAFFVKEVI
jgi:hypothetical protein